ncbi:hypothetical protein V6N11_082774 [Hibiscus sabdariffa]|uniref:RNase H type-1 domain-containing protein n=1 Tax=Hibiscus sabdariffa TaxID=183260 RepID=A0ABR2QK94_9ROSI
MECMELLSAMSSKPVALVSNFFSPTKWVAAPPGWVKANVDGASVLQGNTLASEIRRMLSLDWEVRTRKITRDCNRVADALVGKSRGLPMSESIFDAAPRDVTVLIQEGF